MAKKEPLSKQKKTGYILGASALAVLTYGYSKRKNNSSNPGAIMLLGTVLLVVAINQIAYS